MEGLSKEAQKARNAYVKKWRAAHPESVKKSIARYWEKRAAELAAQENPVPQHEKEEPTE